MGGAPTKLTLTVTNPNPTVSIPNFSITDNFPRSGGQAIIKVADTPNATSTCTGTGVAATFNPNPGDTSITATGGTVAPNGSCTVTVQVAANWTNGVHQTSLLNNTIAGATDFTNDLGLVPADASAQIRAQSPLNISKTFAHSTMASGSSDTVRITFSNTGTTPLTITSFTDDPIDGVDNPSFGLLINGPITASCTGAGTAGSYVATGDNEGFSQTSDTTIAAGGSCTITVPFTGTVKSANTPVSFTNTIAQGSVGTGTPGVVNQRATSSVIVTDTLRVIKSVTPSSSVAPGNPIKYRVTTQNWSGSPITNLVVTDPLTNGQTFLTGTIGGINFTPVLSGTGCNGLTVSSAVGDASVVYTIGTVPARSTDFSPGSCSVDFWAMTDPNAAHGSTIRNALGAGSVCYNGGATCNGGASNTTTSTTDANTLTMTKTFSPAGPLNENTVTRMTLTLSNLSANPVTDLTISDNLPTAPGGGQMRVASVPNIATTCGGSPTITATANSTSIAMNGATVPARASNGTGVAGSCSLQVDVVGPAGVYNNTATAAGTQSLGDGLPTPIGPISANGSFTYTSTLSANKSFSPSAVTSGGTSTVRVRLSNSGVAALTGVRVIDPLPAGMVLADPVNAYTTCGGATSFNGNAGDSSIQMSGATVSGNGTCDLLFNVTATGATDWVNTIPVGNITANGGVNNQTAVTGTLTRSALTGPSISKTINPSTITFPGQVSQLTITILAGTSALSDLGVTDYFTVDGTPGAATNGMRIAPTVAASTTCTGGIVNATPAGSSISLRGASLSAGTSCTITANVTSTAVGGTTNFIPAGSISTKQGLSNTGQATGSLTTQANIGVTKQFMPNLVKPGERSRLRITFYNPTALPVSGLGVLDTLPAGVTVPVGPNATTTCSGGVVTVPDSDHVQVAGANIPAASGGVSASCYAEIDVLATAQGDYLNTIPAGAITATVGGAPATNSKPASDTLRAKSPVVIHKAIDSKTLDTGNPAGFTTGTATKALGATATLTVSIHNPNAVNLTRAYFTDILPSGLVIAQTPSESTTCAGGAVNAPASGTSFSLTGATLPANGTCTVSVNVLSNISGSYTNTIAASAVGTFEGVTNEEPTSAKVTYSTPPEVTKQFSPPVIATNGISTLTIFLGNTNTQAITLSSAFTDNLPKFPGNILVAPTPNVTKTCPGAVTAVAGSSTVTYANGAKVPVGGCTISVDVTGSTAGVHTNSIAAAALKTDLGNNQDPATATLTISSLGYITGKMFRDNNVIPNGTFEAGTDTVISGESVTLHAGADCSGALVDTQTTDAAGNYLFSGIAAGVYSVCQASQPAGTVNGITTAGGIVSANGSTGAVGIASNPTSSTSEIVNIILNGDGSGGDVSGSTGNNFAEVVHSSISGKVFLDQNNNGIVNGPDTGISGDTINLTGTDANGAVSASTVTAADGSYSFSNLLPGTYTLTQPTQPPSTANGITTAGAVDNGGTAGTATIPTVVPSVISGIILPPNTTSTENNFAEIPKTRTISGTVFLDYNNNGVLNGSDYGISGVTIDLTGTDVNGNAVSATTTTVANGTYSFTNLPAGTYTINQSAQPPGTANGTTTAGTAGGVASNPTATSSRVTGINLSSATLAAGNDFAEVPGAAPDLTVVKTHSPTSFGEGSSNGYFTITPQNIGSVATSGTITIVDTLPAGMTVVAPAAGTGWTCAGNIGASVVSCTSDDVIGAGASGNSIMLHVSVAGGLAGQLLTNTAVISGGGELPGLDGNNTYKDTVAISTTANVSGKVWRDEDHDRVLDAGEELLPNWIVELVLGNVVVASTKTGANGAYTLTGVSPGSGYQIRFREPTTGAIFGRAVPNEQGIVPTNGVRDTGNTTVNSSTNAGNPAGADLSSRDGTLKGLLILAGDNIIEQSLPLDPAGVVYDSVTRLPVAGAVVTISGPPGFNAALHVVGGSASVTTPASGFYQFLLLPAAPVGDYTLTVTTYPPSYAPVPSTTIPVCTNTLTAGALPNPALVQTLPTAPATAIPLHNPAVCPGNTAALAPANQGTTQHYFTFTINPAVSGDIVNNHIPLDPVLGNAILVSKTTPRRDVSIGDIIPYTVQATNQSGFALTGVTIRDVLPAGFKYVEESGMLNGAPLTPQVSGTQLSWTDQDFAPTEVKVYTLMLVVGGGVDFGEYTNRAFALNGITGLRISNEGSASVRVVADSTFDCAEIIGKVFNDRNANGVQDEETESLRGEEGIAGAKVVTAKGWIVTTDSHGRYHIPCAAVPELTTGSNFILKLDTRSLPTGFTMTTDNPATVRVTRGKMVRVNFGVALPRVVRLDLTDDAFIPGAAELLPQWAEQLDTLIHVLKQNVSDLRLIYHAGQENKSLVKKRMKRVIKKVRDLWEKSGEKKELNIAREMRDVKDETKGGDS